MDEDEVEQEGGREGRRRWEEKEGRMKKKEGERENS